MSIVLAQVLQDFGKMAADVTKQTKGKKNKDMLSYLERVQDETVTLLKKID